MFLFKARFYLTILKVFFQLFITGMILIQIPELRYDFGPKEPVQIDTPLDLYALNISQSTFISIRGTANFEKAFKYNRYGLTYTYFNLEGYGQKLVARTYENVSDEWNSIGRFVGRLRPFEKQPFAYRIHQIYRDKFKTNIPADSLFLAVYDVPQPSGWQIGSVILAACIWLIAFYVMFLRRWKKQ